MDQKHYNLEWPKQWSPLDEQKHTAYTHDMCSLLMIMIIMGGGAGPAGQVLAGPLFCFINEQIIFINERRVLGLTYLFAIFFSVSFYACWNSGGSRGVSWVSIETPFAVQ